ncbi:unnamed protein product [Polarella glacialis]|uniref:Aminotransferase class V domain-containing protein n=1 Tax=Polarella glacialis TaxID=89957 RepID=A0A813F639_POLGL|nr:unnamed protein product [Polarella glacialis]
MSVPHLVNLLLRLLPDFGIQAPEILLHNWRCSCTAMASRVEARQSPSRSVDEEELPSLAEYSVVYTNRSLNHMSAQFQRIMRGVSASLKEVYGAHAMALVPGSGTFAMEAVARQFGTQKKCLVLRNGYFSYRWTQIFEMGSIPSEEIVLKGKPTDDSSTPPYAPCCLHEVLKVIHAERPSVVFAPHVETSSGIILPDWYIMAVAEAVHQVGGIFVLDCIASGCIWVNMDALGVDVLISAPQKGWSGSPCVGIVMLSKRARSLIDSTKSTCFAVDLRKWVEVMETYEKGGHMYHATMPTDSISRFWDVIRETEAYGIERAKQEQLELGSTVRRMLALRGFKSVAADAFAAPGVIVSYTEDPDLKSGAKLARHGLQISAGVPLMLDEFTQSAAYKSFRLGLFGLDKLRNMSDSVELLQLAVSAIADQSPPGSTTSTNRVTMAATAAAGASVSATAAVPTIPGIPASRL